LVAMIAALDSGALRTAIGELRRTPTGAYVIYTAETQTPIFIGSPFDTRFQTALEEQQLHAGGAPKNEVPLFNQQLHLLAKVWKAKLKNDLRAGNALYVDARFSGQVILKRRQTGSTTMPVAAHVDTTAKSLITNVMNNPNAQDR